MEITPDQAARSTVSQSAKERFLQVYEQEHAVTMKVLRAYPTDQLELRPHESCRTAREVAWIFVLERGLGEAVFLDRFAELAASGDTPAAPESWDALLSALEDAHRRFGDLVRATPPEELSTRVRFLTGPNTVGEISRMEWLWFLLHDQIHHRGQFSVYLRMAGGKVPSIYGPSGDEPWM